MRSILTVVAIVWGLLAFCQGDINQVDENGNKQGHWEKKYKNGKLRYSGQFIDNEPIGLFKRFSNKGKLSSTLLYKKGVIAVKAQFFHENGKVLAEGVYIAQKKDSTWKFYSENEQLLPY